MSYHPMILVAHLTHVLAAIADTEFAAPPNYTFIVWSLFSLLA